MKMPFFVLLLLLLLKPVMAQQAGPPAGSAPRRLALVIGNDKYQESLQRLRNAGRDADAVAEMLTEIGFTVHKHRDLTLKAMGDAVNNFKASLVPGCVAAIYYSGHGMEISGANYLIPVDADLTKLNGADGRTPAAISTQALPAADLLDALEKGGASMNIVIFDCGRNNPLAELTKNGVAKGGLAEMSAPAESIIVFSAAPGKAPYDGDEGGHSPFCSALLQELPRKGVLIEQAFKHVARRVIDQTRGNPQGAQQPWRNTSLVSDFVLNPEAGGPGGPQEVVHAVVVVKSELDDKPSAAQEVVIVRAESGAKQEMTRKLTDESGRVEFQLALRGAELSAAYSARIQTPDGPFEKELPGFRESGKWTVIIPAPSRGNAVAYSFTATDVKQAQLPPAWSGDTQVGRRDEGIPMIRSGAHGNFTISSPPLRLGGDFFMELELLTLPNQKAGTLGISFLPAEGDKPVGVNLQGFNFNGVQQWQLDAEGLDKVVTRTPHGPHALRFEKRGRTLFVCMEGQYERALAIPLVEDKPYKQVAIQFQQTEIGITRMSTGPLPGAGAVATTAALSVTRGLAAKSAPGGWQVTGQPAANQWVRWQSPHFSAGTKFSMDLQLGWRADQSWSKPAVHLINLRDSSGGQRPLAIGFLHYLVPRGIVWQVSLPGLDEVKKTVNVAPGKPIASSIITIAREDDVFSVSIDGEPCGSLRASGYGAFDSLFLDTFNHHLEPLRLTLSSGAAEKPPSENTPPSKSGKPAAKPKTR